ncbi:serine/threonine-protein kinase [Dactylosporangium matsuzakiense]|uniref:serine/threonine-protein kinase n=2 Tax=Dactylosporangium matsuzakiense TaxID=53360 RepID=UPI0022F30BD9|nr:serine/threonine-protein kinase [Dactylosporangium matsuzakiense]
MLSRTAAFWVSPCRSAPGTVSQEQRPESIRTATGLSGSADEVLGNRYRLIAPVGSGGMAVVWRARDLVLDRDVAVKLLAGELANKPGNRERIRSEAQVVARLQHPNITAVHDYGEAGDVSAGRTGRRPYVVMELLEGELLSDRLRSGPMSWRRATQICAQVAAGLAAAHESGVVHRDIKPSNVMLVASGAKILDFGVAGLAGSFDPDDERDGTVFGTPAYLAPERLLGGGVVSATDVYTVGLLAYRCLTDRLPWHADTPTQMIANHVYEPPNPLPDIPGMPAEVARLITRCLAKDPDSRPSAAEVAGILAAATGIHVVLPGEDGLATQEVHAPPAGEITPVPRRAELPRRATGGGSHHRPPNPMARRTWTAVIAAVAVAGATTGMIIWKPWAPKPACNVDFYIHPQALPGIDKAFEARATVANIGNRTLDPWYLSFLFRGGQQVDRVEGAGWEQAVGGLKITGPAALPPGKAVTIGVYGHGGVTSNGRPPLPPSDFVLNDTSCDVRFQMLGPDDQLPGISEIIDAPPDASRPPTGQPPGPQPGGGNGDPGGPQPGFDPDDPGRRPDRSPQPGQSTPPAYLRTTPPAQRTRRGRHA